MTVGVPDVTTIKSIPSRLRTTIPCWLFSPILLLTGRAIPILIEVKDSIGNITYQKEIGNMDWAKERSTEKHCRF